MAVSKCKVSYLIRDELLYELSFRNVPVAPNQCVELLRKLLRQHINTEGHVKYLNGKIDLEDECKVICAKISIVSELLENPDIKSPLYVSRVNCKINHLLTRTQNLGHVKNLNEENLLTVKELFEKVQNLKLKFSELTNEVPKEEVDDFESKLDNSQIEEENVMYNLVNISSSSPIKTPNNRDQFNTHFNLPSSENRVDAHASSLTFNKLPNPLEKYLQRLPTTDGLDISKLLQFLRCLVNIKQETNLKQSDLYQILVGHCEGPLLNKIIEAKNNNIAIDTFHSEILTTFVPITLREQLKFDLVYRPQFHQEPLPVYIAEVKINSEILKTSLQEADIVSFIRNGIRPEERNKLVFEGNPRTFADLDELCIKANNINYNDYIRDSHFNNSCTVSSNLRLQSKPFQSRFQQPASSNSNKDKNSVRACFKCNKPGHVAKDCYSKISKNA